jgi:hypothetical protein
MYKGVSATLLVIAVALAGCGGDDDAAVNDSCTANAKSMPTGAKEDPCPQNDPACPGDKYSAVATCGVDGHWKKDMNSLITCECVPKAGTMTGAMGNPGMPGGGMPVNHCGDGILDGNAGEQCDKLQLGGAKCADMIPGSTKILLCKADCKFDMASCMMTPAGMGAGGDGM